MDLPLLLIGSALLVAGGGAGAQFAVEAAKGGWPGASGRWCWTSALAALGTGTLMLVLGIGDPSGHTAERIVVLLLCLMVSPGIAAPFLLRFLARRRLVEATADENVSALQKALSRADPGGAATAARGLVMCSTSAGGPFWDATWEAHTARSGTVADHLLAAFDLRTPSSVGAGFEALRVLVQEGRPVLKAPERDLVAAAGSLAAIKVGDLVAAAEMAAIGRRLAEAGTLWREAGEYGRAGDAFEVAGNRLAALECFVGAGSVTEKMYLAWEVGHHTLAARLQPYLLTHGVTELLLLHAILKRAEPSPQLVLRVIDSLSRKGWDAAERGEMLAHVALQCGSNDLAGQLFSMLHGLLLEILSGNEVAAVETLSRSAGRLAVYALGAGFGGRSLPVAPTQIWSVLGDHLGRGGGTAFPESLAPLVVTAAILHCEPAESIGPWVEVAPLPAPLSSLWSDYCTEQRDPERLLASLRGVARGVVAIGANGGRSVSWNRQLLTNSSILAPAGAAAVTLERVSRDLSLLREATAGKRLLQFDSWSSSLALRWLPAPERKKLLEDWCRASLEQGWSPYASASSLYKQFVGVDVEQTWLAARFGASAGARS